MKKGCLNAASVLEMLQAWCALNAALALMGFRTLFILIAALHFNQAEAQYNL